MNNLTAQELVQYLDSTLKETNLSGLGALQRGKVRDIYIQPNRLVLVSTDRHSSFDRIIAHVPFKGAALNLISSFWFEQIRDIVQNHLLAVPDPNVTVAKKCQPLPVEVVMRGYITGVTGTSLWVNYQQGQRDFGSFKLPGGMKKNQKLEQPVMTPTTKSDQHDRPLLPGEVVSEGLVDKALWDKTTAIAAEIFKRGQEIAARRGLILVDTKYEFGTDENGQLVLIDEVHTPDSSRYWQLDSYEQRFAEGQEPEYFDKEFLRLWFKEYCDPYNDPKLPEAPKELVAEMSRRYIQIYEQITGKKFDLGALGAKDDMQTRIQSNLKDYAI